MASRSHQGGHKRPRETASRPMEAPARRSARIKLRLMKLSSPAQNPCALFVHNPAASESPKPLKEETHANTYISKPNHSAPKKRKADAVNKNTSTCSREEPRWKRQRLLETFTSFFVAIVQPKIAALQQLIARKFGVVVSAATLHSLDSAESCSRPANATVHGLQPQICLENGNSSSPDEPHVKTVKPRKSEVEFSKPVNLNSPQAPILRMETRKSESCKSEIVERKPAASVNIGPQSAPRRPSHATTEKKSSRPARSVISTSESPQPRRSNRIFLRLEAATKSTESYKSSSDIDESKKLVNESPQPRRSNRIFLRLGADTKSTESYKSSSDTDESKTIVNESPQPRRSKRIFLRLEAATKSTESYKSSSDTDESKTLVNARNSNGEQLRETGRDVIPPSSSVSKNSAALPHREVPTKTKQKSPATRIRTRSTEKAAVEALRKLARGQNTSAKRSTTSVATERLTVKTSPNNSKVCYELDNVAKEDIKDYVRTLLYDENNEPLWEVEI